MAVQQRIKALRARHAKIESKIHSELKAATPDEMKVIRWKKQKLLIRQELENLGGL